MTQQPQKIDYIQFKSKLNFVSRPIFEFCGAFVSFLEDFYGLNENDPKIKELEAEQPLFTEVLGAIKNSISPYLKREIEDFSFAKTILQSVLKAFLFDFPEINSFSAFLKKYDSYTDAQLFNFIGGSFLNEHSQSNCEDWGTVLDDMEKMQNYILNIEEVSDELKEKIITLYKYPEETKMRIRHIICYIYSVFKPYEAQVVEQAKKQQKRYSNLMEIDFDYFSDVLQLSEIAKVIGSNERILLCISYMYPVCFYCKEYDDSSAFLLNGFLCDQYFAAKEEKASLEAFLKILGDDMCLKIFLKYAQKPYYVQELARELNIPPAQLRMYNNRFQDANLLLYDYEGRRRHYYLNKEQVKQYIDKSMAELAF